VRVKLTTPPGMPPGSSVVRIHLASVGVCVSGIEPLLVESQRSDDIYRAQIESMRVQINTLRLDVGLLRKSRDEMVHQQTKTRAAKHAAELQVHEQSKLLDLMNTLIEGERRAVAAEWGELYEKCEELARSLRVDLNKAKADGRAVKALRRELRVLKDKELEKEVSRLRGYLRTRDARIADLCGRDNARRQQVVERVEEARADGKLKTKIGAEKVAAQAARRASKAEVAAARKVAEAEAEAADQIAEAEAEAAAQVERAEAQQAEAEQESQRLAESIEAAEADKNKLQGLVAIRDKAASRQAKILEVTREGLKLAKQMKPPAEKDWTKADYNYRRNLRKQMVDYLSKVFNLRKWRVTDMVSALSKAKYLEDIFNSDELWTMRLEWLRGLLLQLQRTTWNADLAVKVKVGGNLSEAKMDELRTGFCMEGIDKETGLPIRAVLVRHPHRPLDIVYVPTPIVSRWRWVPRYHRMRTHLGLTLSADRELCTRAFLPELKNLIQSDLDMGLLDGSYIIRDGVPPPCLPKKAIFMLMTDGFPLNTMSIEHMCIGSANESKGLNQSEAGLITLAVGRMSEKNSTMHALFKQCGVDVGDVELRANPVLRIDAERSCAVEILAGADKKGVEVNRGCSNCCPWCVCGVDMIHIRPWPAGYRPTSIKEAVALFRKAGCEGIISDEILLEAAHELLDGETLPQKCRFCAATKTTPWHKVTNAKRPYANVAAFEAAKADAAKSAASTSKEGMRAHASNRQAYARIHGHQHEFARRTLAGGMDRWVPELLHALPLNAGRQMFKQKVLRLMDTFAREQGSVFFKAMGAPINLAKKDTGRAKAERWWKGSMWDELVRGGLIAPGGLAAWVSSFALMIADCHEDARQGGGKHSSVSLQPPSVFTPAPPPRTGGVDIDSDSDDEPVRRPAPAPLPEKCDADLTLAELAEKRYGKSLGAALLSMVDGFDLYKHMHVLLMEPPATATDEEKESFALDVAAAVNDMFHNVEASSTLGSPHKSYTWHELLFIVPLFIRTRGDLWPMSTARLESRGARMKVIARSVVIWAKAGVRKRTIAKRQRAKGKTVLRGGPERAGSSFTQNYTGSGVLQLLGAQGLREQMLRAGTIAPKKSNRLGKHGRVTAPRQTKKWDEHDWSLLRSLSCRRAFELCLRGRMPRFYDVRGEKSDWSAALEILSSEAK
jgi:hypothetical protein